MLYKLIVKQHLLYGVGCVHVLTVMFLEDDVYLIGFLTLWLLLIHDFHLVTWHAAGRCLGRPHATMTDDGE